MPLAALPGKDGIIEDFGSRSPHSRSQEDRMCSWIVCIGGSELQAETNGQFVLNIQFSRVQMIQICGRPFKIICSTDISDLLVEPQG